MPTKRLRLGPRKMEITMYLQECSHCYMPFAVPRTFDNDRREDCQTFFCPNGHGQSYEPKEETC